MAVREAIAAGELSGPELFLAGRLLSITTATTAYYPGMYEIADGVDEVRRAVRRQLAHGADLINSTTRLPMSIRTSGRRRRRGPARAGSSRSS